MKKSGFTLAEVLLSMAIIGIVAAVTAPTLINMMPNKDKAQTIKYQKLISEINAELLNNRSLYTEGIWDTNADYLIEYVPEYMLLDQTEQEKLKKNKYVYLLKEKLNIIDEGTTVSSEADFKTADGYKWKVMNDANGAPTAIIISMNGSTPTSNFGSATNKYPNKFAFLIDKDNGNAGCDKDTDPITCRYLNCPFYMNNRKLDYECITSTEDKCACK